MSAKRMTLLSAAVLLLVTCCVALGGQGDATAPQVADDPLIDTNVVFRIDYASTADQYPDTATLSVYLIDRSQDEISSLHMRIKWNSSELDYVDSDKGTGWPTSDPAYNPSVWNDSLSFSIVDFDPFIFDSTKAVITVDFATDCFSPNDTATVEFNLSSTSNNRFFRVASQQDYRPDPSSGFDNGGVILNMTPVATLKLADSQTIEADDTVSVPVKYTCNFQAGDSIAARFKWYDDSLKFVRVDTAGTLTSGKNVSHTKYGDDSVRVIVRDVIERSPTEQTLMNLVFVYKAEQDNLQDTVRLTADSVRSSCQHIKDENVCTGTNCIYLIIVPQYSADIYFKDMAVQTNTSGHQLKEELTNNFTVDMENSHQDSVAAFRVDTTTFDKITWDGSHSTTFNSGSLTFKWDIDPSPDNGLILLEDDGNESDSIPKSSTKREISWVGFSAGSNTGIDPVQFIRDEGGLLEGRDSKLKAYNRPIVIYSYDDVSVDSLFRLQGGEVTVSAPSSCPFLYVWTGAEFELENTLLTHASFAPKGQVVTDYYLLQKSLVEKDNQYMFQLREIEDELSYVDDMELLVVDHPLGTKVAVTPEGQIMAADAIFEPVAATDHEGADVLSQILDRDGNFFSSSGPGHLVMTFRLPEKPIKNNLVVTAGPGGGGGCDPKGPGGGGIVTPRGGDEETFEVWTVIEEANGNWIELTEATPRPFNILTHQLVDAGSIQLNEEFRVRISWSQGYLTDEISFYTVSDQFPIITSRKLSSVFHSNGTQVKEVVSAEDGEFATLVMGERLDIYFPAGDLPLLEGYKRDFVVRASGYFIPPGQDMLAALPLEFRLFDNYPNPFNARTELRYTLPKTSHVELSIINTLGQKVTTLVDDFKSAGTHSVIWDGRNNVGETVASGVYFYFIRAGDYIETRKMTLLK